MATSKQKSAPLHDPSALAAFGRLELVARLVVEGYMMGQHKSPFKGSSIEFVEHRQYYPGDEIRHIDWRAYGKTGKYYIKEFEDETNLRCYLVLDASGSMNYSASTISKFEYARLLTASLGYLLLNQRDAAGLLTFDTAVRSRIEPSASRHVYRRMVGTLENCEPGDETGLVHVLAELLPTLERRCLLIVLSDCFDDIDELSTVLKRFRHAQHDMILFQIVAPEEEDFPFSKPTQFRNIENPGKRLLVDPHRLRETYLAEYRDFCEQLGATCRSIGIDYSRMVTTEPFAEALGIYLDARSRRVKRK